jgi:acetyl esterase/lipase
LAGFAVPAGGQGLPDRGDMTAYCPGEELDAWQTMELKGRTCLVSAPLTLPPGSEINHHRVRVDYEGSGYIYVSVAHHESPSLAGALKRSGRLHGFRLMRSGQVERFSSQYGQERVAWLVLDIRGDVRVKGVHHTFWHGRNTIYGHVGKGHRFGAGALPYRLLYPYDYDPNRAYPLVVHVSGSGGVGTDNEKQMEPYLLSRFLWTQYYMDPNYACFSVVPQIPPGRAVPKPYYPAGEQGAPDPIYHPDWPAVNEQGFFTEGSLSLVEALQEDPNLNVDPNRVYFAGFSYGGKAMYEFLRAGRETFAAGVSVAGWPIGRAYSQPDERKMRRLVQEVSRHKHIPVRIYAGQQDRMARGSAAADQAIRAVGGESKLTILPGRNHLTSAAPVWMNEQTVRWLFAQNRGENPAPGPDPYPGGAYGDGQPPAPRPGRATPSRR